MLFGLVVVEQQMPRQPVVQLVVRHHVVIVEGAAAAYLQAMLVASLANTDVLVASFFSKLRETILVLVQQRRNVPFNVPVLSTFCDLRLINIHHFATATDIWSVSRETFKTYPHTGASSRLKQGSQCGWLLTGT